ncbi:hypothetical protein DFJ73DRAFT_772631 [Zopfochytrium polystomum]|nr:hypothetical protein DFJ73DRAFT_772631 [Zopfochytrium polystomum]
MVTTALQTCGNPASVKFDGLDPSCCSTGLGILLLDEPTTRMDVTTTASVWHLLRAVAGASSESGHRRCGCTILLTTHSMEEAEASAIASWVALAASKPPVVQRMVRQSVPNVYVESQEEDGDGAHDETIPFVAAAADGQENPMFRELHDALAAGALPSVASVGLEQATLDDVFIKLKEVDRSRSSWQCVVKEP